MFQYYVSNLRGVGGRSFRVHAYIAYAKPAYVILERPPKYEGVKYGQLEILAKLQFIQRLTL